MLAYSAHLFAAQKSRVEILSTLKVNIAELLDQSEWSAYQKWLTVLVALAVTFDGFDIQILGFAIPSLMKEWQVARSEFGPVLAVGLAGMALGAPIAGYLGDRFGRRITLIGCVLLFGLATIGSAFVHGLLGLTVLRLVTGMGTGGLFPNVSALTAELAPLRRRSTAVKLTLICIPLGGMLGGVLAARVLPRFGWRGLYGIGGVLPMLCAGLMLGILPESPRFMARRPEYWTRLAQLLTRMGHTVPPDAGFEDRVESGEVQSVSPRALLTLGLARETVGLWIAFFFCIGGIYLVFGWLPAMLASRGLDLATASSGLAIYNFGGVVGILIWSVLIPLLGSRGPLLFGSIACAASALALMFVPIQVHSLSAILVLGLGVLGLLANAVQTSMYALAAHVYPTSIRATGVAYSAAIGRTGGLLSSVFGSYFIQTGTKGYWSALAIAMICATFGLAWVSNHYPATRRAGG